MSCSLVWFKRDLRIHDHAPLSEAAARGKVLPVYIVEPALWQQEDAAARHYLQHQQAAAQLRDALAGLGQPLVVRVGNAEDWLARLAQDVGADRVHAHQETGNDWTFARDRRVISRLRELSIDFIEFRQFGVQRGKVNRNGWAAQWHQLMAAPRQRAPASLKSIIADALGDFPSTRELGLPEEKGILQAGGRRAAVASLESFVGRRGRNYQREMSSPLSAEHSCSRLSVHLATGALSVREVFQRSQRAREEWEALPPAARGPWVRSLRAFESRLHWHCHFIQKLESEPEIEFRNINRGFDGLREDDFNPEYFARWRDGTTGWPMVDACMRCLAHTGWINFRMRAMLMSVASYHLWLHWRQPALHLAKLFTDYEPGIHYSQCQMQAGVTGINVPRVYNPIKQSLEQDPNGEFIRRWCPELAAVPGDFVHMPWKMSGEMQRRSGCTIDRHYPAPLLEHEDAARAAKLKLKTFKQRQADLAELSREVYQKHGSRQGARRRRASGGKSVAAVEQGSLFDGD